MIKKIDIQRFGLFSNYNWYSEVGDDLDKDSFKKVNIIYGRNYSGKTTLSRIFRCVENRKLHEDYPDGRFTLYADKDIIINETNLNYNKNIRVYNTDFVKANLSWLHDKDGEIKPFALLGSGNNDIKKEIENIEKKIKSIDIELGTLNEDTKSFDENTLYLKQSKKKTELDNAIRYSGNLETDLTRRITNKANQDIKKNPNFINQKNSSSYNVNSLCADIDYIRNNNLDCLLSDDYEIQLKVIIKEEDKESISHLPNINFSFRDYINNTKILLAKEIGLSLELKELIENDLLQDWVKTGRNLHKQSDICAFCKNPISETRRKELDGHFSKESEDLEQKIQTLLNQLESLKTTIESYLTRYNITKDRFYVVLHPKYEEIYLKWNNTVDKQNGQIKTLKEKLSGRLKNLFSPFIYIDFSELETNTIDFDSIVNEFNSLITENNNKAISIEEDKDNARKALRYHTVKNFLSDIDYDVLLEAIVKAKQENGKIEEEFKQFESIISENLEKKTKLEDQIDELKTKLDDQALAAEKINEHLRNFFGHDSIQLKPSELQIDEKKKTRFVVKRGDDEATNLSEGECSLVAFCYFMARIEDEIQAPDAKDKLIIYIDDPISSLDNSHVFFMFGLIESILIPQTPVLDNQQLDFPKYELKVLQLFISTHNLDFLKYLYNLRNFRGSYKEYSSNVIHLLIEKQKKNETYRSILIPMPKHMRQNITEYVYCFSEIYKVAGYNDEDRKTFYEENYTTLFNIGNNMRKFLESFLAFKCAGHETPLHFLPYFFNESDSSELNRAPNEYSHLAIWLEKGTNILDIPEAERLSKLILKCVKKVDIVHFNSLCAKLGKDTNLV